MRQFASVFKLRIGVAITLNALAGMAIMPGTMPGGWQAFLLALAVLASSAAAGAFNQYAERDLDARMARTATRPFVTGAFAPSLLWPLLIVAMLAAAVAVAAVATNVMAALYVFLGAVTYGVIYTVWLKRRSWLNIVIGGLAGSFAVLAGAAAVDPGLSPQAIILAVVLFLWTPPHFWSLAIALKDDYAAAGVPMLPVVAGNKVAAVASLAHTALLVPLSLLPLIYGMNWIYGICAGVGGALFLVRNVQLVQFPDKPHALTNFKASLVQVSLLLVGTIVDKLLFG